VSKRNGVRVITAARAVRILQNQGLIDIRERCGPDSSESIGRAFNSFQNLISQSLVSFSVILKATARYKLPAIPHD